MILEVNYNELSILVLICISTQNLQCLIKVGLFSLIVATLATITSINNVWCNQINKRNWNWWKEIILKYVVSHNLPPIAFFTFQYTWTRKSITPHDSTHRIYHKSNTIFIFSLDLMFHYILPFLAKCQNHERKLVK